MKTVGEIGRERGFVSGAGIQPPIGWPAAHCWKQPASQPASQSKLERVIEHSLSRSVSGFPPARLNCEQRELANSKRAGRDWEFGAEVARSRSNH